MKIKTSKHKCDRIQPRHSDSQLKGGPRGERFEPVFSVQLPSLGRYVEGMVHLFYQSDEIVRGDPELQAWCWEITEVGLCHAQDRGKICPSDKGPSPDLGDRALQSHPPFRP